MSNCVSLRLSAFIHTILIISQRYIFCWDKSKRNFVLFWIQFICLLRLMIRWIATAKLECAISLWVTTTEKKTSRRVRRTDFHRFSVCICELSQLPKNYRRKRRATSNIQSSNIFRFEIYTVRLKWYVGLHMEFFFTLHTYLEWLVANNCSSFEEKKDVLCIGIWMCSEATA